MHCYRHALVGLGPMRHIAHAVEQLCNHAKRQQHLRLADHALRRQHLTQLTFINPTPKCCNQAGWDAAGCGNTLSVACAQPPLYHCASKKSWKRFHFIQLSVTKTEECRAACLCQEELQELAKALAVPVDSLPPRNSAYLALNDLTECKRRCLRPQRVVRATVQRPWSVPTQELRWCNAATTKHTRYEQPALPCVRLALATE